MLYEYAPINFTRLRIKLRPYVLKFKVMEAYPWVKLPQILGYGIIWDKSYQTLDRGKKEKIGDVYYYIPR
ncbi:hypothetical protein CLFO_30170 [Clostridium formicaceticum]|uniref:Uncharacterized protein n=1 Tax=Clostridium formicaceticum TaxID=1497 RepID=A0AAC9RK27_9CLOT|nr:hypothetical protein BJL90_20220 [Clostridium formicaceticum]ARE88611.1 hypothetical protein CLFO_30170 [Clostridium formicaceticum]